jgi:hypothetical protein
VREARAGRPGAGMNAALMALALLAQPECRVGSRQAALLAKHIVAAEEKYDLPSGILAAVVLVESAGRNVVSPVRRDGWRDHGPAQIHSAPSSRKARDLRANLLEGARLLAASRSTCAARPGAPGCKHCPWGRYNAGSTRWCVKVLEIYHRLRIILVPVASVARPRGWNAEDDPGGLCG